MHKYIVRYAKKGDAKFISHLDFLRAIQRAMRRAELPLKFSEGFNPHPCLSFAHPLGVGVEGERELFEVELTKECPHLAEILAPKMPQGIHILEAFPCEKNPFAAVSRATYAVCPEAMPAKTDVAAFLAMPEIVCEKRTKSGVKETDIRPDIFALYTEKEHIFMCLSAGSTSNLKPQTVMEAMEAYVPGYTPGFCRYVRLSLMDAENTPI